MKRTMIHKTTTGRSVFKRAAAGVLLLLAGTLASCGEEEPSTQSAAAGTPDVFVTELNSDTGRAIVWRQTGGEGEPKILHEVKGVTAPPAVASAPDGLLYVVYRSSEGRDWLEEVDPADGSVHGRQRFSGLGLVASPVPTDVVSASADGRAFVYMKHEVEDVYSTYEDAIMTFDSATGRFRPQAASIEGCGAAAFLLPDVSGGDIAVVCADIREVHVMSIGPSGEAIEDRVVSIPDDGPHPFDERPSGRIVGADVSEAGDKVYVVTENARVTTVDLESASVESSTRLDLPPSAYVPWGAASVSPDGTTMFVGSGPANSFEGFLIAGVYEVEIGTWDRRAFVRLPDGASVLVGIGNGRALATGSAHDSLVTVDVRDGRVERSYRLEGAPDPQDVERVGS